MNASHINTDDRNVFSEQLTPENTAVVLVDHQIGLFTGVVDTDVLTLKHNVVALARAAKVLGVPTIVTATAPDGMWGPIFPELLTARPDVSILARTTVNPWDEPRFVQAVEALGRQKLIIAGISTEVCLGLTAIRAVGLGYHAYAAIDASGTFSVTKRETGLLRMTQAGVIVTDYATTMVEILKDNAHPLANELYATLDMPFATLVGQIFAANNRKG
ncbi:hydrolase [Ktedonobacter sp. SOSP1-85]|uniref:isochorismatase family protein n=1 Tax=Ktedonobacter sp. SOSP1-85 TaxID=2778367 RepID=UPI0019168DAA|nr:isochorismatase family protein [Ktedonobacter sp. SOSP1-85]GHO80476.1 hydrolase [Ktedonobacter sp. SOSP1-85]